jgi:hypothetical protein
MAKIIKKSSKLIKKGKRDTKIQQPSPKGLGFSAHLEELGKKRIGRDRKKWIVKQRKNGSLFWARFVSPKKFLDIKSINTKNENKIKLKDIEQKGENSKSKIYAIDFCEPGHVLITKKININQSMFDLISKGPTLKFEKGDRNAYLFGKKFSLPQYKKVAEHRYNEGRTGLLNVTGISRDEKEKKLIEYEKWHKIFRKYYYDYDNRNLLNDLRRKISDRILFIGKTFALNSKPPILSFYAHFNKKNEINSIIIDNHFFFNESLK